MRWQAFGLQGDDHVEGKEGDLTGQWAPVKDDLEVIKDGFQASTCLQRNSALGQMRGQLEACGLSFCQGIKCESVKRPHF